MIQLIKNEFERRMKEECLFRIHSCLDVLDEDLIWYTPNENVNSIGNLVLHLSGNIQQYINSTLGDDQDLRKRELEFSAFKSHRIDDLRDLITTTINKSQVTVAKMEEKDFLFEYEVQCFKETGLSILIHVIEHTSYHTGQITQMTKWLKDIDTEYYTNLDLDKTNK